MMYRYEFVVSGKHEFPFDMLRYDGCHPMTQEDVSIMTEGHTNEARDVRLVAFHEGRGWVPMWDRWSSFGWQVVHIGQAHKA